MLNFICILQLSLKEIASYLFDGSGIFSVAQAVDGFAYIKFDSIGNHSNKK